MAGRDELDAIRSRIIEIVTTSFNYGVRRPTLLMSYDRRPEVERHILTAAETPQRNFDT